MFPFDGLWWLLLSLGPLFLLQRGLHKELQSFLLLLTRRVDASLVIFSILFFPGVALHEASHFFMARILGVRTGKFSLIPTNLGNGRLRLGYVETEEVDFFRDALIGFAPLLSGMLFIGFVGKGKLGFLTLWTSLESFSSESFLHALQGIVTQPNYWVWFYAAVTVSGTMMPSASDRRAWIPLLLAIGSIFMVGIVFGLGPILLDSLAIPVNNGFKSIALILTFSSLVQLVVLLPVTLARKLLSKITGIEVRHS